MRSEKLFFLVIISLLFLSVVSAVVCDDSQTIIKLSSSDNAHGAIYSDATYPIEICYNEIFIGKTYIPPVPADLRVCNAAAPYTNKVVGLSATTNAHAQIPIYTPAYPTSVCYGDLQCSYTQGECTQLGPDFKCIVELSSIDTNAHLSTCSAPNSYSTKICCKSPAAEIPPATCNFGTATANWNPTIQREGLFARAIINPGNSDCNGKPIRYDFYEVDCIFPPCGYSSIDSADTNLISTKSVTETFPYAALWESEWIRDTNNLFGNINPEYFFRVSLVDDPTKFIDSTNNLVVTKCGDGDIQFAYEGCDDGCTSPGVPSGCDQSPLSNGDGCSSTCQRETSLETGCAQYKTSTTCAAFDDSVPHEDETKNYGLNGVCKLTYEYSCYWETTTTPENPIPYCGEKGVLVSTIPINLLKADSTVDQAKADEVCYDSDDPRDEDIITPCNYAQQVQGDCNTGSDFITIIYTLLSPAKYENEGGTCSKFDDDSTPCPSITKLPFFTFWNFIITALSIAGVYAYLNFRKKSKLKYLKNIKIL